MLVAPAAMFNASVNFLMTSGLAPNLLLNPSRFLAKPTACIFVNLLNSLIVIESLLPGSSCPVSFPSLSTFVPLMAASASAF